MHNISLPFHQELAVDLFAGAGGASLGISRAYRHPDIAVNHNPVAIAVHRANHAETEHFIADVFEVDPHEATCGRPVGILWASPDCRHFSVAAGRAPRSQSVRSLAWVIIHWAYVCRPRLIKLENVVQFKTWGPLNDHGTPDKAEEGRTYRAFVAALTTGIEPGHPDIPEILHALEGKVPIEALHRGLGYNLEARELLAADYGTPTKRLRLYVVARCDGRPIVWPEPTHAEHPTKKRAAWRGAAECVDFSLPGRSIFGRKKPLASKSKRRIAMGVWRNVINTQNPFIVPQGFVSPLRGTSKSHVSSHALDQPLSTISAQGTHHALVQPEFRDATILMAPHIVKFRGDSTGQRVDAPMPTITAGGAMTRPAGAAHALGLCVGHFITPANHEGLEEQRAFLEQANGGEQNRNLAGRSLHAPMSTVCTTGSQQRLITACLVKYYGQGGQHASFHEPMHTIPTKSRMGMIQVEAVPVECVPKGHLTRARQCARFLRKHLPDRIPRGVDVIALNGRILVDITLRMLNPRELARAQGFPEDYFLEQGLKLHRGKLRPCAVTKTDQIRLIGNSVCPQVATAIVRANLRELIDVYEQAA